MAVTNFEQFPSPNSKYPFVGPNYQKYGEVAGYVYYPWNDQYYVDKNARQQYAESTGQAEKAPGKPGLGEVLVPAATVLGAGYLATEVGKGAGAKLSNSLFGESAPSAPGNAAPVAGAPVEPRLPTGAATPTTAATAPTSNGMIAPKAPAAEVSGAPATPNMVSAQRVEITPVGPAENGGTLMSDGSTVMPNGDVQLSTGTTVTADGQVAGSTGGITTAQALSAAAFVLQSYQAYKTLNDPNASTADKTAAVGGAAAAGGMAYATTGAAGAGSVGAIAAPVAGVTGLYTGYKTAEYAADAPAGSQRNRNTAAGGAAAGAGIGAAIGSVVPVVGTAIGGVIGAVVGGAAGLAYSMAGSSKDKYQMIRDKGREYMQQSGILDGNYQGTLADGSKFDFGKDGKGQVKLDFNNPLTGEAAALANVIAAGEGYYGRSREAMATLYAGAAMSNANGDVNKVRQNIMHFAQQRKFNADAVQNEYNRQFAEGLITKDELNAFSNTLRQNLGASKVAVGAPPVDLATGQPLSEKSAGMLSKSPVAVDPNKAVAAAVGPQTPGQSLGMLTNRQPAQYPSTPAPTPAPQPSGGMLRSKTKSPGIDKEGRRLPY